MQPTVEEYDITQLHENTYYDVCVKVFTTQLSVDDHYDNLDRQHPATVGVWNNYEDSEPALGDSQLYRQSAAGSVRSTISYDSCPVCAVSVK